MAVKAILVEDNEIIRIHLISAMQELTSVEVIAIAETQAQALQAFRTYEDQWQLVIVDLFLKEGSGLGVLCDCVDRRPAQVALVLTNYPTAEMRVRCLKNGADGIFDKSTQLEDFFDRCLSI